MHRVHRMLVAFKDLRAKQFSAIAPAADLRIQRAQLRNLAKPLRCCGLNVATAECDKNIPRHCRVNVRSPP